ncbi:MAG TPA: sulfur oxidation c-type cytochrome SoxA [Xanthobacteraceae bacterium]|jgi:sulfur-oxidizing protein SoxA|nr:sulfur oxidation c-type cytochrome SoxA [Xanthobacteraceae bacterium]
MKKLTAHNRFIVAMLFALLACSGIPRDLAADEIAASDRRSGYSFMSRDTQLMQDDDKANPGMLSVLEGETLWGTRVGAENKSCADCHGNARVSMKGVAARYPALDAKAGRPIDLEQRIRTCRTEHQKATPLAWESKDLLALSTFVARQSRGMPIARSSAELETFIESGRKLYTDRRGQLNLSCSQCHDDNWGKRLAGNAVPQAHPTGYPLYRLEWQDMGSLQRRLRNCLSGMRAEVYSYGAPELVDLEIFLMWRAGGMPIETPAVRP